MAGPWIERLHDIQFKTNLSGFTKYSEHQTCKNKFTHHKSAPYPPSLIHFFFFFVVSDGKKYADNVSGLCMKNKSERSQFVVKSI